MGSYNYSARFDGALTYAQVKSAIEARCLSDRDERGYGHGLDGMRDLRLVQDPKVKTAEDVERYVEDFDKGSGIIALVTDSKIPHDAYGVLKPSGDALQAEARKVQGFAKEVLTRIQGQSSKTRGCSTCGSAIAVAYMKPKMLPQHPLSTLGCPVCDTPDMFLTETDKKRRDSLMASYERAKAKVEAETEALKAKHQTKIWLVSGWCRD